MLFHGKVSSITSINYDVTGDTLALGDSTGNIFLFNKDHKTGEYKLGHEFHSHQPEFDYLKSVEIEGKINKLRFLPKPAANNHLILSTNDKTIKLWRVSERTKRGFSPNRTGTLKVPKVESRVPHLASKPKKVFANGHAYHINSISLNSDQETFISSDDLRINLWNLNNKDESFLVVDMKPENMEDLTEVITCSEFHPKSCNLLAYSSSKGLVRLGDLRQAAYADRAPLLLEDKDAHDSKSFFAEIISSLSDIKFSPDGRYILTRDYVNIRLWDLHMDNKPVLKVPIHSHLRGKLVELYESDCIFDKFDAAISPTGSHIIGGTYGHTFSVAETATGSISYYEATKPKKENSLFGLSWSTKKKNSKIRPTDNADVAKKSLRVAWHPNETSFAVSAGSACYIFAPDN